MYQYLAQLRITPAGNDDEQQPEQEQFEVHINEGIVTFEGDLLDGVYDVFEMVRTENNEPVGEFTVEDGEIGPAFSTQEPVIEVIEIIEIDLSGLFGHFSGHREPRLPRFLDGLGGLFDRRSRQPTNRCHRCPMNGHCPIQFLQGNSLLDILLEDPFFDDLDAGMGSPSRRSRSPHSTFNPETIKIQLHKVEEIVATLQEQVCPHCDVMHSPDYFGDFADMAALAAQWAQEVYLIEELATNLGQLSELGYLPCPSCGHEHCSSSTSLEALGFEDHEQVSSLLARAHKVLAYELPEALSPEPPPASEEQPPEAHV